jgi:hypothetical protein
MLKTQASFAEKPIAYSLFANTSTKVVDFPEGSKLVYASFDEEKDEVRICLNFFIVEAKSAV